MILHLLRHAEAEDTHGKMTDAERKLTTHGHESAGVLAAKLKKKLSGISAIFSSPMPRARQTAEIFADHLGKADLVEIKEWLATGTDAHQILKNLKNHIKQDELMLVGHEPWISELTSILVCGHSQANIKVKKLGLVTLRLGQAAPQAGVLIKLR